MVRNLQWRGSRQDDVSVPSGLVEPKVHCDHGVELRQHLVEAMPARSGQHRIARDGDQGSDLTLTRGGDFFDQTGHRNLAEDFLGTTHPGLPSTELRQSTFQPRLWLRRDGPDRRARKHGTAGRIEVTGQDVDHVDQPAGQAPELLVAQANSAIDNGPLRPGELAGQVPDPLGTDAGDRGNPFR